MTTESKVDEFLEQRAEKLLDYSLITFLISALGIPVSLIYAIWFDVVFGIQLLFTSIVLAISSIAILGLFEDDF